MNAKTKHELSLLIVGFVLTTVIGAALSYFVTERQRITGERVEAAKRLAAAQSAVEQDVLGRTSRIVTQIQRARQMEGVSDRPAEFAQARDNFRTVFEPAWTDWRMGLYLARNQVTRAFGPEAAALVYRRGNDNFVVDDCGVVVLRTSRRRGTACAARGGREAEMLKRVTALWSSRRMVDGTGLPVNLPVDFQASMRIARVLLDRLLLCRNAVTYPKQAVHCRDVALLRELTNRRVELATIRQEQIADEFLAVLPQAP